MLTAARRRLLVLAPALLAPSACTLLVPTDGLTGGGAADGGTQDEIPIGVVDSGGISAIDLGDASVLADVDAGTSIEVDSATAPEGSAPDAGTPSAGNDSGTHVDASGGADSGTHIDASGGTDAGSHIDATPPGRDAAGCSGDLSDIGASDFSIAFELRTTQSGLAALINQRAACSLGMFWDLRLSSGELRFETDDGSHSTNFTSTGPEIDDGASHTIVVTRISGTAAITVDGNSYGSAGSQASFGALAPLATGTDVCEGDDGDGTAAFEGTISEVCVGTP